MKTSIILFSALVLISIIFFLFFIIYQDNYPSFLDTTTVKELEITPKTIQMSAWLPWWEEESAIASIENAGNKLKIILPVWYQIGPEGKLIETPSSNKEKITELAINYNIKIFPTISNAYEGGFDPIRVSLILNDPNLQDIFIEQLIDIASEKNYNGWDLDWEEVYAQDKDAFSAFLVKLSNALNNNNLILSVTVHAQTGSVSDWTGTKGQDLQSIGETANQVRVMAYDFHNSTSPPGSIIPLDKLTDVIDHNLKYIPLNKFVLGLPTYGYDWVDSKGTSLQNDEINKLIEEEEIKTERDDESFSFYGKYIKDEINHSIWYENHETIKKKIDIANSSGIYQFCFWHLGGEDPLIWKI